MHGQNQNESNMATVFCCEFLVAQSHLNNASVPRIWLPHRGSTSAMAPLLLITMAAGGTPFASQAICFIMLGTYI